MSRTTLQPEQLFASKAWGFSQVAISPSGSTIHVAGQVAWGPDGKCNAEGREEQFRIALKHVFVALEIAGATPDDIQMLRLYIPNFNPSDETRMISRVLIEVFGSVDPPASTWIGVQALAQPEYLIEVEAVAIIASDDRKNVGCETPQCL